MTFADKLRELRERATLGSWYQGSMHMPDGYALAWLGSVYIDTDAPKVNGTRYKEPEDDATFIIFLVNHAAEIEALVRAAAQCAEVQEEPCRFDHNGYCEEHYLDHQLDGCRVASLHNALAALEKEKS